MNSWLCTSSEQADLVLWMPQVLISANPCFLILTWFRQRAVFSPKARVFHYGSPLGSMLISFPPPLLAQKHAATPRDVEAWHSDARRCRTAPECGFRRSNCQASRAFDTFSLTAFLRSFTWFFSVWYCIFLRFLKP